MAEPRFTPVENDPFALGPDNPLPDGMTLTPVEGDPFARSTGMLGRIEAAADQTVGAAKSGFNSFGRGVAQAGVEANRWLGMGLAGAGALADWMQTAATGTPHTEAQDVAFEHFVAPSDRTLQGMDQAQAEDNRLHPVVSQIAHTGGHMATDIGMMVATDGATEVPTLTSESASALTQGATMAGNALTKSSAASALPATMQGLQSGEQTYEDTGDPLRSVAAGLTEAGTTTLANALPVSMDGKLVNRLLAGAASGAVGGEAQRSLHNEVSSRQSPFGWGDVGMNALFGATLGGVMHTAEHENPAVVTQRFNALASAAENGDALAAKTTSLVNDLTAVDGLSGAAIDAASAGVTAGEAVKASAHDALLASAPRYRQIAEAASDLPPEEIEGYAKSVYAQEVATNSAWDAYLQATKLQRGKQVQGRLAGEIKQALQVGEQLVPPLEMNKLMRWAFLQPRGQLALRDALAQTTTARKVPDYVEEAVGKDFENDGALSAEAFAKDAHPDAVSVRYPDDPAVSAVFKQHKLVPYRVDGALVVHGLPDAVDRVAQTVADQTGITPLTGDEHGEANLHPEASDQGAGPAEGTEGGHDAAARPAAEAGQPAEADRLDQGQAEVGHVSTAPRAQPVVDALVERGVVHPVNREGVITLNPDVGAQAAQHALEVAAEDTYTEPTPAQAQAGNYRKGGVLFKSPKGDLKVRIETPDGAIRRGPWGSRKVRGAHYGYIPGTRAADGDPVDVLVTRHAHDDSRPVAVINQHWKDGLHDEIKVVLGTRTKAEALETYAKQYPPGLLNSLLPNGKRNIVMMSREKFMRYLHSGQTDVPPHPVSGMPMAHLRREVARVPEENPARVGRPRATGEGQEPAPAVQQQPARVLRSDEVGPAPAYQGLKVASEAPLHQFGRGAKPVSAVGVHYSPKPGLTHLDPRMAGTGSAGGERLRHGSALGNGDPLTSMVHFYVRTGEHLPAKESVVQGNHAYEVRLNNLYDVKADPEGILADLEAKGYGSNRDLALEEIHDAGYDGWIAPSLPGMPEGHVASVFGDAKVPVKAAEQPRAALNRNPTLYSGMEKTLEAAKNAPKKAPAHTWVGWLDGAQRRGEIKQGERDWIGIDRWLAGHGDAPVTRDDVLSYIKAQTPKIEVVKRGVSGKSDVASTLRLNVGDDAESLAMIDKWDRGEIPDSKLENYLDVDLADVYDSLDHESGVKYGQYTLPGGENYQEHLLTLPPPDGQTPAFRMNGRGMERTDVYRSDHWHENNVLVHVRMDDRVDPGTPNLKVKHIHEVQSDWHQSGRKHGYRDDGKLTELSQLRQQYEEYLAGIVERQKNYNEATRAGDLDQIKALQKKSTDMAREANATQNRIFELERETGSSVPDAPFKQTKEWSMLGIKHAVLEAIRDGSDAIEWDTGATNADRYSMRKQIDALAYAKNADGTYHLWTRDRPGSFFRDIGTHDASHLDEAGLERMVGKDIAKRIVAGEGEADTDGARVLTGDNLSVGGQGMTAFYDKLLVNEVNQWAKRFGGKVEAATTPVPLDYNAPKGERTRATVHRLMITKAMREAASEGLPMFQLKRLKAAESKPATAEPKPIATEPKPVESPTAMAEAATQFSWEAVPSTTLPGYGWLHKASNEFRTDYTMAIHDAIGPAILEQFGIDHSGVTIGFGGWEGAVNPSVQEHVAWSPAKLAQLEKAAATYGLLLKQDGVAYHHPDYATTLKEANAVHLELGRALNPEETAALYAQVAHNMREAGMTEAEALEYAPVPTATGVRFFNFRDDVSNRMFNHLVGLAAEQALPDPVHFTIAGFKVEGGLIGNNWESQPHGEGYKQRLVEAGGWDSARRTLDQLGPQVEAITRQFRERARQGEAGDAAKAEADTAYAAEATQARRVDRATLAAHVERFAGRMKGAADFDVRRSPEELPADHPVRQWARTIGAPDNLAGAYYNGRMYLFSDHVHDLAEAERVTLHEMIGHGGLRAVFGDDFEDFLRDALPAMRETPLFAQVERTYRAAMPEISDESLADEYMAALAETADSPADRPVWTRLLAATRNWLRSHGFKRVKWTEDDLKSLVRSTYRGVRDGRISLKGLEPPSVTFDDQHHLATATYVGAHGQRGFVDHYADGSRELRVGGLDASGLRRVERDGADYLDVAGSLDFTDPTELVHLSRFAGEEGLDGVLLDKGAIEPGQLDASGVPREDLGDAWKLAPSRAGSPMFSLRNRAVGTSSQEAILKKTIAHSQYNMSWGDRMQQMARDLRDRIMSGDSALNLKQSYVDALASVGRYERRLNGGLLLDASESAYKMAWMAKNTEQILAGTMKLGVPEHKAGSFVPVAGRKGLMDVFAPLYQTPDGKSLDMLWEGYAYARRASELIAQSNRDGTPREKLLDQAEIDELLKLEQQYPVFKKVLDDYQQFNHQLLDLAVDRGALSREMADLWMQNTYVPFYRAFEEDTENTGFIRGNKGIQGKRVTSMRLHGSEHAAQPIIENIIKNTGTILDKVYSNEAMRRVVALTNGIGMERVRFPFSPVNLSLGEIEKTLAKIGLHVGGKAAGRYTHFVPQSQMDQLVQFFRMAKPVGHDIVSVMEGGRPVYYKVTDPMLLRSVTAFTDIHQFDHVMGAILGVPAKLLRTAVTLDPRFIYRNLLRDTVTSWAQSGYNPNVFKHMASSAKEVYTDGDFLNALRVAGYNGNEYFRVNELREHLTEMHGGQRITVLNSPKKLYRAYHKIGFISEQLNRIALARKVVESGGSLAEAAWQAQNTLNFQMRGDSRAMQLLIRAVPFLNARVQGLARLYDGMLGRDVEFDRKAAVMGFLMKSAVLAAAAGALDAWNWDDKRYNRIPEASKDTYYHFFIGNQHYMLPKPFELGALTGTLPERVWRVIAGKDNKRTFAEAMKRMAVNTFQFTVIPQTLQPILEDYANKDSFSGIPIVSMAEQNQLPGGQYDSMTSPTAVKLAHAMPSVAPDLLRSPDRLEHLYKGYTGTVGAYLLMMADATLRASGQAPVAPESRWGNQAAGAVLGTFGLGDASTDPRTKYLAQYYDAQRMADEAAASVRKYVKEGHLEDAREAMADNATPLAYRTTLRQVGKQMKALRQAEIAVYQSRALSPEEKRARLTTIQQTRVKLLDQVGPMLELVTDFH